jgi:beta-glucosidase
VLYSFHPGSEGGYGLADVLTGQAEPGGRLPVTLPRHVGQIPIYHDHKPTGRPMDEYHRAGLAAYANRSQRLIDCVGSPRYRFGYGLSYSTFAVVATEIRATDGDVQI